MIVIPSKKNKQDESTKVSIKFERVHSDCEEFNEVRTSFDWKFSRHYAPCTIFGGKASAFVREIYVLCALGLVPLVL